MLSCDGLMLWLIPVLEVVHRACIHPALFYLPVQRNQLTLFILDTSCSTFLNPRAACARCFAGMAHAGNMRCSGAAQKRKCLTYFINSFAVRVCQEASGFVSQQVV